MSVWSMCPPDFSMGIGCERRIVKLTEHWSAKHSHHEPVYHILDSSSLISSEVERMLRRKRKLHFTYECSPYQGTCAYETISLIIDSDTVVRDVWGEVSRDIRRILRGYGGRKQFTILLYRRYSKRSRPELMDTLIYDPSLSRKKRQCTHSHPDRLSG